jgi:hypothetical protein
MPGSAGSDGRPSRRAGPWPVSGRPRPQPAPEHDPARSATAAPPPASARPPPGRPPPRPTRAVDRAARTPQTTCNSIRSSREGCPPHRRDPQGHPWASASETEVTGRTGGHQPAGHRTGGHQPAGHRTAGHRTAGQPDPGHRNRGGHRMVDTDRRRTAWQALAFPTAAATPYRWGAVRKLGRSDAAWSISNQDSSTERTLPRRVWPPPRPDSDRVTLPRPAGASAHCSPRIRWVESRTEGYASSVMASQTWWPVQALADSRGVCMACLGPSADRIAGLVMGIRDPAAVVLSQAIWSTSRGCPGLRRT